MIRSLLARLSDYPCQRVVETVTDYVEGTMPARERRRLERHLAGCDGCERYIAQMRRTIELTGQLTTDDVDALDASAREDLLEAFRRFHGEAT